MGTFTMGLMYSQLTAAPGVRFDLAKMSWIGKAASEPRALAVGEKSGLTAVEDLRRSPRPVRLGTGPVGSPTYYAAQMLGEATGFRVEVVPGFDEDEAVLAALRGDFAGGLSSPSSVAPMVNRGLMRILMSVGTGPELPPSVVDARTIAISPLGQSLMSFAAIQSELGRVTAAPPGVPADRLEVLRQAYMSAVTDPALQAELRQIGLPVDPMDGPTVTSKVAKLLQPPPDVAAWLRAAAAR
jgi:tripartite-type tricarboxylate transporter receptor subunit TctC